jgi:hypothetical protein
MMISLVRLCLSNLRLEENYTNKIDKVDSFHRKFEEMVSSRIEFSKICSVIEGLPDLAELTEIQDIIKIWRGTSNHLLDLIFEKEIHEIVRKFSRNIPPDTNQNLWIVKPGNLSRGRNIKMFSDLDKITEFTKSSSFSVIKPKWIIQKYVENPFLITGRKFDIRLYVLLTSVNPFTLWFYEDYYIRLSPTIYSSDDKETSSMHLTNFSVSKYVKVSDNEVYKERMLSRSQFCKIVNSQFGANSSSILEAKIKLLLKKVFSAGPKLIADRPKTYEMMGVDILVDETLSPWILEINISPSMETGTSVTQEIVSKVSEDLVKVIVDEELGTKEPRKEKIGKFELLLNLPLQTCREGKPNLASLAAKGESVKNLSII